MKIEAYKDKKTGILYEREKDLLAAIEQREKHVKEAQIYQKKRAKVQEKIKNLRVMYDEHIRLDREYKTALDSYVSRKTQDTVRKISDFETQIEKCKLGIKVCQSALKNQQKDYRAEFRNSNKYTSKSSSICRRIHSLRWKYSL